MVTTLALPRLLAGGRGSLARIAAVTGRDLTAVRHSGYWLVVLSGFFEPVLYLLAIGVGVGGLVGGFELPDGSTVSYAAFVAPAMLAASAMNGAMTEATFNFFAKMKWVRLYDAMVATPLRPFEIAIGELGWALIRGSLYSVAFLGIMVVLDLTTIGWAVLALPASVLVGFAFGGLGMAISTLIRSWVDFDYVNVVQFGMFLFSATFVPIESYPVALRFLVEALPLYHAVELVRDITTGRLDWSTLGHVVYLAALAAVGIGVAARRLNRVLCK
jgi:lipooligosaccharide transport system permease protein